MFTGIISELGKISRVEEKDGKVMTVNCYKTLDRLEIGDSIAINGACQTAIRIDQKSFSYYSSKETLALTNLNDLKTGSLVNLERPISINSLLDGHIVQGHVDGTGILNKIQKEGRDIHLFINCPENILRYLIPKGSIAIDGVSLTINEILSDQIRLTVIPITFDQTIFHTYCVGQKVNIEIDLIAKYIDRLLNKSEMKRGITKDFLTNHGFL